MTFPLFLQHLFNGISLGSLYALIAIGYTMVYGILRLINFAHGDVVMLGSYVAFYTIAFFFLPWWAAFPLAILLTALIGVVIERVAYKPLREVPRINLFTSAVAVSFLLENLGIVIFGGRPKAFARPEFMDVILHLGEAAVVSYTPIIVITALVLFGGLMYVVHRTKVGTAMRALSKDIETTGLMGVNTDLIITISFAIGSALAAAGGTAARSHRAESAHPLPTATAATACASDRVPAIARPLHTHPRHRRRPPPSPAGTARERPTAR